MRSTGRATSELDREVAIKVLPEELAADADRLKRFKREAKAVAKLSHSSILEIFDFGPGRRGHSCGHRAAGRRKPASRSSTRRRGDCRRRRPVTSPPPLQMGSPSPTARAWFIATSNRGILPVLRTVVSRSLTSALHRCADQVSDEAIQRIFGPCSVDPGTILGTVGYMSPEQVRGETADPPLRHLCVGCVLYEMLSGPSPVQARHIGGNDDRHPARGTPLASRPRYRIRRRDGKDSLQVSREGPRAPLQSAADLAFALREIDLSGSFERSAPRIPSTRRWLSPVVIALVVIAALLLGGALMIPQLISSMKDEQPVRWIAVLPFDNLSGDPDPESRRRDEKR